jgi:class 3 adenylate cyclase
VLPRDAGALERHGGTVEKFIGDEVVAVFDLPRAHETTPFAEGDEATRHAAGVYEDTGNVLFVERARKANPIERGSV